jgi:hypothetical protein
MKQLFFLYALLVAGVLYAAVPTITSFTPVSGHTGMAGSTTVTITGTNFNTTATNNIVYFGGARATVNAATSTSLTVTAPWGATWDPVSVTDTTTNLTAYSYAATRPFIPTFPSNDTITTKTFAAKVDFSVPYGVVKVVVADFDGDGMPDMAAVANSGSAASAVSIFRKTSTTGFIASSSFDTRVDLTASSYTQSIAVGDLDGDGKPDIVTANYLSGTISIFHNTSTPGTISFESKVDISVGSPGSVAIGDLDGDGLPDIVVGNISATTVYVLRNTSTAGSITFDLAVSLTTANTVQQVLIADVTGDGKPEILATSYGSSSYVSIFKNNCSSGTISFASKADYSVGTYSRQFAVGDMDGDGKPDLIVSSYGGGNVYVLRNTRSSNSISFASGVVFAVGSWPFAPAIGDLDGDGKPDMAVSNYNSSTVSIFRNTATSGSITSSSFDAKVDLTTNTSTISAVIADLDGDGKPELIVGSYAANAISVYRNLSSKSSALFYQIP